MHNHWEIIEHIAYDDFDLSNPCTPLETTKYKINKTAAALERCAKLRDVYITWGSMT